MTRLLSLLPPLAVLVCYLPAIGYDLVWDDLTFLRDTAIYRDPETWPRAIFGPFVISGNYFRPLPLLTYALQLQWTGLDPAPLHAINILIHALNALLLTTYIQHVLQPAAPPPSPEGPVRRGVTTGESAGGVHSPREAHRWVAPIAAGLVYGLHPALLEGVVFVSGRFDLLLTTFLLLALLTDRTIQATVPRAVGVGGLFLLAAATKEMAVVLPLTLPLLHRVVFPVDGGWFDRAALRRHLPVYGSIVGFGVLYLLVRRLCLGYLMIPGSGIEVGSSLQHLATVFRSLGEYLLLAVWPFTSITPIHHADLPIDILHPDAWASLVVGCGVLFLLWKSRRSVPGSYFLAAMVTLLPVINILPLDLTGGAFIADRFLTFPLAFATVGCVMGFRGLRHRPDLNGEAPPVSSSPHLPGNTHLRGQLVTGILAALWLTASAATILTTLPHWQGSLSLWSWVSRTAPKADTAWINLSREQTESGDAVAGLASAQRAIALNPEAAMAWNNSGLALFTMDRQAEAKQVFQRAAAIRPGNPLFWNNLAGTMMEMGETTEAEQILKRESLGRDPSQPLANLNLGALYLGQDRPDLAEPYLERASVVLPPGNSRLASLLSQVSDPQAWLDLGDRFLEEGDAERADAAFVRAGDLGARPRDVAVGRSGALLQLGRWEDARTVLEPAIGASPDDARLHNNLGVVEQNQGAIAEARQHYERAAELSPGWFLPKRNLSNLPE